MGHKYHMKSKNIYMQTIYTRFCVNENFEEEAQTAVKEREREREQ